MPRATAEQTWRVRSSSSERLARRTDVDRTAWTWASVSTCSHRPCKPSADGESAWEAGRAVFADPAVRWVRRGTADGVERSARWRAAVGKGMAAFLAAWSVGLLALFAWIQLS